MDRRAIARHEIGAIAHQTSAPPLNEKKERKKDEAAKAIDRPNTIWISLRKPPDVSPKARLRPVMMMTMTAMIFATGPSIDSSIELIGLSHGIDEPEAKAGLAGSGQPKGRQSP